MTVIRQDILSITEEKLVQIANVGLLKRAGKAITKGDLPTISLADDASLTATFADGHKVIWASNTGLADSCCTCPAAMCRHRVQTVLTYRQMHGNPDINITSPHRITPEKLSQFANPSLIKAAEKLCQHGLSASIYPMQADTQCPTVQLPMASIRFWGGDNLHQATCDCIEKQGCEHILLAACAYASLSEAPEQICTVQLTRSMLPALTPTSKTKRATDNSKNSSENSNRDRSKDKVIATEDTLINIAEHYLNDAEKILFSQLLQHGVGMGMVAYARLLDDVLQPLKKRKAIWLIGIIEDLTQWLQAYENRRSHFDATHGVALIGEYLLRKLAKNNTAFQADALGVGVQQETVIATTYLTALGCRISKTGHDFQAQTMLLDDRSQTLMVHCCHWQEAESVQYSATSNTKVIPCAYEATRKIQNRRIGARINLTQLAQGRITCQRAKRMANHEIKFNFSRSAYNQVLPQQGDWSELSPPICYDNISQLIERLSKRPLTILRGRYHQPNFAIVKITHVVDHGYAPAEQTYAVLAIDVEQRPFWIKCRHRSYVPYALEAFADAFAGVDSNSNQTIYVAGVVDNGKDMTIEPWAIVTDQLYVLDIYLPKTNKAGAFLQKSPLLNLPDAIATDALSDIFVAIKSLFAEALVLGKHATMQETLASYPMKLKNLGLTQLAEQIATVNDDFSDIGLLNVLAYCYLYDLADERDFLVQA